MILTRFDSKLSEPHTEMTDHIRPNNVWLESYWGYFAGHGFSNSNPLSRFGTNAHPSGAST
jgi:hypothetical protein